VPVVEEEETHPFQNDTDEVIDRSVVESRDSTGTLSELPGREDETQGPDYPQELTGGVIVTGRCKDMSDRNLASGDLEHDECIGEPSYLERGAGTGEISEESMPEDGMPEEGPLAE